MISVLIFENYWKVAAKDSMDVGDRIFLPISVKVLPASKQDCHCSEEEINFIRGLELFKVMDLNSLGLSKSYAFYLQKLTQHPFFVARIRQLLLSINLLECLFRWPRECLLLHDFFMLCWNNNGKSLTVFVLYYFNQGGIGIKRSLDELSASCLSSDCSEPPRLVSFWWIHAV